MVPCFHSFTNNLKAEALDFAIKLSFKSYLRFSRTTSFFRCKKKVCEISHGEPSTICAIGVVCDILVACGFRSIGLSGRCLNTRMAEHKINAKNKPRKRNMSAVFVLIATIVSINGVTPMF